MFIIDSVAYVFKRIFNRPQLLSDQKNKNEAVPPARAPAPAPPAAPAKKKNVFNSFNLDSYK